MIYERLLQLRERKLLVVKLTVKRFTDTLYKQGRVIHISAPTNNRRAMLASADLPF